MPPLRTKFSDREDLLRYLSGEFPAAYDRSPEVAETRGGRRAAEARLRQINPTAYAATRNHLDGAVTHLSPYLRHGVLSLAEVRQAVLAKSGQNAGKLVNELGWRDYWQRVYAAIGEGIWQDREPYKTGFTAEEYAPEMPKDLMDGTTRLACMDGFAAELVETGYLHNHARMWLAAYLVHHRRVRWQAGAHWFLTHLLDGDPASNNLSWQWIASTFSAKPYVFNRENLEHNTKGIYCQTCPLARRGCPFDAPTPVLESRLFPNRAPEMPPPARRDTRREPRRR